MLKKENIARFIGFDIDGSLLGFDIDGSLLGEESKLTMIEANQGLWRTLNKQGKHAFAITFVMLFSSRQSWDVNEANRKNKERNSLEDPTSCYLPLKQIAEQNLESTLCPVLLADAYSERPDGYSYTRALLRAGDATAYHPGFVFDKNKTGLLYMQVHNAANNMRNCDFLSVASRPTKIFQLPCKSNAAYLYIEENQTLLYVNKIKQEVSTLTIQDAKLFTEMRDLVDERIANEEHDFETLHEDGMVIRGITLSDDQITTMAKITGHKHTKQDYLIIYDAIEDLEGIMIKIHNTYQNNKGLLPQNVIVRLNLYSINNPDPNPNPSCMYTIRGTGPIDLRPKETVVKMAKQILEKEKLQDEDFNNPEHCFSAFISDNPSAACFTTRSLSMPTVKHQQSHEIYAPISDYHYMLTPDQIMLINDFIDSKMQPSFLHSLSFLGAPRPIKKLPPRLFDLFQILVKVTNEADMSIVLAEIMKDNKYSVLVIPDSKIHKLLRALATSTTTPNPSLGCNPYTNVT
jgi:hypothetical protein